MSSNCKNICSTSFSVTGRKSKDLAITPETTQPHLPTAMVNCRATCSLDAKLRMLNNTVDVMEKYKLSMRPVQGLC